MQLEQRYVTFLVSYGHTFGYGYFGPLFITFLAALLLLILCWRCLYLNCLFYFFYECKRLVLLMHGGDC
jgi:hypothetical protein